MSSTKKGITPLVNAYFVSVIEHLKLVNCIYHVELNVMQIHALTSPPLDMQAGKGLRNHCISPQETRLIIKNGRSKFIFCVFFVLFLLPAYKKTYCTSNNQNENKNTILRTNICSFYTGETFWKLIFSVVRIMSLWT